MRESKYKWVSYNRAREVDDRSWETCARVKEETVDKRSWDSGEIRPKPQFTALIFYRINTFSVSEEQGMCVEYTNGRGCGARSGENPVVSVFSVKQEFEREKSVCSCC